MPSGLRTLYGARRTESRERGIDVRDSFTQRRAALDRSYRKLVGRRNASVPLGNGVYRRYRHPVLTPDHVPLTWRYDFSRTTNPFFMERLGVNATFNAGAIRHNDAYCLICRVEGYDRKSFFAVARSKTGTDHFVFDNTPIALDEYAERATNVYDMRLTRHEDGWIYGLFCVERPDPRAARGDTSSAVATAGIVRSRDLVGWERLPDLATTAAQQRNVVLHPEIRRRPLSPLHAAPGRLHLRGNPVGDLLGIR